MTSQKPKKPRGRPPIPASERKTTNLTFRARGYLREWLGTAAKQGGRSISEEIEQTLESHRKGQDIVLRALGGENTSQIIKPLLLYFSSLETDEIDWKHDSEKVELVKQGVNIIIDAALSNDALSIKDWMPRVIHSGTEDMRLAANTIGKAIVVLQLLGLAEIPLEGKTSANTVIDDA